MVAPSIVAASKNSQSDYALGYTNSEQERLIRQAMLISPITERLFREAGIGLGQRVLDLGSGMGDVSMLLARIVGSRGEVIGVERDAASIARAESRVASADLQNVSFIQSDVNEISSDRPFDAVVGRFILMFLPDPVSVLRSAFRLVRPGGVFAFQDPCWLAMLAVGSRLPLWSRVLRAVHETFVRSGVNPEMGLTLYQVFQEVGLPAPAMHMDLLLGSDQNFTRNISDLICSLRPLAAEHNVPLNELGDFSSLHERVQAEITTANTVVSVVPMVSAWARKSVANV